MADGAWQGLAPEAPGDAHTRGAVDQLRAVLGDIEGRLAASGPESLRPQTAAALAEALAALARRMAEHETHVEARLDHVMAELAAVRAAQAAEPEPALLRLIFAAACMAAALSVVGAGVIIVGHPQAPPRAVAAVAAALGRLDLRPSLKPERPAPPRPNAGLPLAATPLVPAPGGSRETYEAVAAALERGEATALPRLTGLAQAGDSRAQIQLASLYETGGAGLPRDLAAARLWTRRAADGGDRVAMHNLALFLLQGEGGGRDDIEAATWFRRAADRGVVDSQYNLGLLYEAGRGVEKNLREAYRWFAVAANAGDATAREKQVEVEGRLTPAERGGLDRDVAGYQPGAAAAADLAVVIPPAATLAETQALLARRGYYVGPIDGVASPGLRAATAAYLRDHPEAATDR